MTLLAAWLVYSVAGLAPATLAVVRDASAGPVLPGARSLSSPRELAEWAEEHGLAVAPGDSGTIAWPKALFGLTAELALAQGVADAMATVRTAGYIRGDRLEGRLREEVERNLALHSPPGTAQPPSLAESDFSFGLHGWFELEADGRSIWASASFPATNATLRAVRYERAAPGGAELRRPPVERRFAELPGVAVDLAWPPGKEPSVREKAALVAEAALAFAEEVRRVSDAIRGAYDSVMRGLDHPSDRDLTEGLLKDCRTTADLPNNVRKVL